MVEFISKDKFITDLTMSSEGFLIATEATGKGYKNLVDPSYKVFIEFGFRGRTFQKTCDINEVYWRHIQQEQIFPYKMSNAGSACTNLSWAINKTFKQQSEE